MVFIDLRKRIVVQRLDGTECDYISERLSAWQNGCRDLLGTKVGFNVIPSLQNSVL